MSRLLKTIAALAVPVLLVTAAATPASAGKCMRITGHGTGVTETVARFMAQAAVKNGVANRGLKASGGVSTTCTTNAYVLSNCTAVQRACS